MVKSMTGYGRAAAELESGKLILEIKTLNSKGCDINIKTSLIPKEKELSVRQTLTQRLQRGTIDLLATFEAAPGSSARKLDTALAGEYFRQFRALGEELGVDNCGRLCLEAALRQNNVFDGGRKDLIGDGEWGKVEEALERCIDAVEEFRIREGESLSKDVSSRVRTILELENEVEGYEPERIETVRARLKKNAEELQVKLEAERFEQEMVFYLEKLDINEEKVRLRQHCAYFMDTLENDPCPGRKLGFIIQEMGREINTTGSKANHASIQKCVVRMKDELEKIREQSMNIL